MQLGVELFGISFQNPVLLASGTCGFGAEVLSVTGVERLGGFVTKSVTLEPRRGNPAPRVAEFGAGMVNSVGLANPGARIVRQEKLPWLDTNLPTTRVFVSVAGHVASEYVEVVEILDDGPGFAGFELNLSCPNDAQRSGLPFALDPEAVREVVGAVRTRTERPILAKLAPNTPDFGPVVRAAEEAGVDGFTLVNTLPGLILDPDTGRPVLGAGPGGVSGPALRALGLHAVWSTAQQTDLPLIGVGGISGGRDAVQYLALGASLVQVGTASFWDPRAAERVVDELRRFGESRGVAKVGDLRGSAVIPGRAPRTMKETPARDRAGCSVAEVVIALDVPGEAAAAALLGRLPPEVDFLKVGLELFVSAGPAVVEDLRSKGKRIFLDLKLHDIPSTVGAAARAAADLKADLLTVHSLGGPKMIQAARKAVEGSDTRLIAVTVLTSLSGEDVAETWGQPGTDRTKEVVRLAELAVENGAHGVVASPVEASLLRQRLPPGTVIVTPGIRLQGDHPDDHAGVVTPAEAMRAGADVLVIGRSVTCAHDPGEAFARVRAELAEG